MNKFYVFVALLCMSFSIFADTFPELSPNRTLVFPRDHGVHPETRFEWWYFTGHLKTKEQQSFGFELTFFRVGINPNPPQTKSHWNLNNLYVTHFAITNENDHKFFYTEKINRDSLKLAGASTTNLHVWNGNWYAKLKGNTLSLFAVSNQYAIKLNLKPTKPILLQGKKGLSQKYKNPGDFSYYYTFTRLQGSGELIFEGRKYVIENALVWMDHEFSTSTYNVNIGWDWISMQLDNNEEIMLTRILYEGKREGAPYNFGVIVRPNGEAIKLTSSDFHIKTLSTWRSPHNINYPSAWSISIPKYNYELQITPTVANQEIISSIGNYWEGSVKVVGKANNKPVTGRGYIELTGYDMQ